VNAWLAVAAAALGVLIASSAATVAPDAGWLARSAAWFVAAAACAAAALSAGRRAHAASRVALLVGVAGAAGGWTVARTVDTPPDRLDRLMSRSASDPDPLAPPTLVRLEGIVRTFPRADPPPKGRLDPPFPPRPLHRFDLEVRRVLVDVGSRRASGVVTVRAAGGPPAVRPGGTVRVTGLYAPVRPPRLPGRVDRRPWAAMEGRVGSISLSSADLVEVIDRGGTDPVASVRARIAAAIVPPGEAPTADRALLAALVLGDTAAPELAETRDAFRSAGAAHLLAISGFHLALLAGGLLVAMRLPGDFGRGDTIVVAAVIVLYAVLLPAKAPIVRAAAMLLALFCAELRGRRADRLTVLGWVTLGLIAWRPLDVFALGAQLSVGITALLIWLGERRPAWLVGAPRLTRVETPREPWWDGPWRAVRTGAMTAFAAWLVAAPAIAWHTGSFSPLAPLAVLVLTPPVVAVLGLGFSAALLSLISPGLGAAAGEVAAWVAGGVGWLARTAASVPYSSVSVPPLSVAWAAAATLAAVQVCRCARWRGPAAWGPRLAVMVWAGVEAHVAGRLRPGVLVRVDALDVGDGTCLVVRSGGETVLWDCGSLTPGLGVRTVPGALRAVGVRTVDAAVVTHANADHYVFVPDVAAAMGVGRVMFSEATRDGLEASATGRAFLGLLASDGSAVESITPGASLRFGSTEGSFLWPADASPRGLGQNDLSSVVRLGVETAAGPRAVLLCGDIQRAATIALLARPEAVRADVLELPHHGGWHDAASAFVEAVGPTVVVQSTAARRARASRSAERWGPVRAAIEDAGGVWGVTAERGSVWVEILEDGSVRTGGVRSGRERKRTEGSRPRLVDAD